jgi:hypothetical protein
VYAGKDGKPAEYSADNVPLTPKHHLPVSTKGVKDGDFTMIFGYPGPASHRSIRLAFGMRNFHPCGLLKKLQCNTFFSTN